MRILPYIAVMFTLLIAACSGEVDKEELPSDIKELMTVVEYNPDSALKEIPTLEQKYAKADQSVKMCIALMKYKAEDKSYVIHSSDSIIRLITKYYEDYGTNADKLAAYYYMGGTYRDMRNYPLAIIWYLKGIDAIKEEDCTRNDSIILANLYGQIADAYKKMRDYNTMMKYAEYSHNLKNKLGKRSIRSIHSMAGYYQFCGQNDSAYNYYVEVSKMIEERNEIRKYIFMLGEHLGFYVHNDYTTDADICYKTICSIENTEIPDNVFSAKADYNMICRGDTDSATYYLSKAYNVSKDIKKKQLYAKELYYLYKNKRVNNDSSLHYATLFVQYTDSVDSIFKFQQAKDMQNDYMVKRIEQMKAEQQEASQQNENQLMIIIVCVLTLTIIFLIFSLKKKTMYEKEIEMTIQERNETMKAYNKIKSELDEKYCETDLLSLINELRDMLRKPHIKPLEETWVKVYNVINNTYPDFKDKISCIEDKLKPEQTILLYLLKTGLSQSDVARLRGMSRQGVNISLKRLEEEIKTPVKKLIE